jgi:hypothetical protein
VRALALEVNDVGLLALRAGASRPEPESPGLALFDGGRLVFGAEALASQFVRETRFDPLHEAATEQALHDAVPGCLAELVQRPAAAAVLQSAGRAYRIEITRPALLAAVDGLYRGLAEQVSLLKTAGEPATLLLSARAARLPGLADRLREIRGLLIVELALDAPASGALRHRERLRHDGEALPFVMRLPSGLAEAERRAPAPASAPPAAARAARPTHVLHAAVAHALGDVPLLLGTAPPAGGRALRLEGETSGVSRHHCTLRTADGEAVVEDRSSFGTFLNGERVAGRAILRVGDRLRLGSPGLELLLIAVEA